MGGDMAMARVMVAMEVMGMVKDMVMVMMVDMEATEDMENSGEAGVMVAMTRTTDMVVMRIGAMDREETITTTTTTELWMMDDQLTNDQGELFCEVFADMWIFNTFYVIHLYVFYCIKTAIFL